MPVLDGFAVARELHQRSETTHIPVIFLSGINEQLAVQPETQWRGVAYLPKPCPLEKLLSTVRAQFDN